MPKRTDLKKILVIGSGPIVIGQAAEFDYAGTQACLALKEEGYEVVLCNSNPATIMTDTTIADKVYMEPLTLEYLAKVIRYERPDAIVPGIGGQTGLNLAMQLEKKGVLRECNAELLGTSSESIERAEDRELFKELCQSIGEPVIPSEITYDLEEAKKAVASMMEDKIFGESGSRVVIEEFLTGPEVSVLSFTDGKTLIPMISSMDHKRALDGDMGLNTGGMGTIAPNPYYTKEIAEQCMKEIFLPTIAAMNAENRTFTGCLYFGLMLTADGPKVIEYNCRFGDPETQVVLPLLESDLLEIMLHIYDGTLDEAEVKFSTDSACCVVMASSGYPAKYETGFEITMPEGKNIYVAGAKLADGKLVTSGGRVLGVTETAPTLEAAIRKSYETVSEVKFENAFYRKDIGTRALMAERK